MQGVTRILFLASNVLFRSNCCNIAKSDINSSIHTILISSLTTTLFYCYMYA